MRRSDFLNKALVERGHTELNSMYSIREVFEEALDIFETLGMLPPVLCDCGSSACYEATQYAWEPEDV